MKLPLFHNYRYLNKACIIRNREKELKADGSASDPWSLCSALQVVVLKSLIELLPMWSTGIMIAVTISQHTFPMLQTSTLNRCVIENFDIPLASFGLFGILTLTIWLTLYDRVLVPRLSKHKKNSRSGDWSENLHWCWAFHLLLGHCHNCIGGEDKKE
ncbi:hypothetical protein BUALT_Bualt09G0054100 [Buddleja alternifolia]|uniref:Uncharacterized protein n=1 Tax=Buddleja alternifolia TaxID=168488 RepID=A0AAV6X7G8_9LAMI|nr:hypothetical protein BUALT_Bualt09G0054100 [Buddleja alternifolia]